LRGDLVKILKLPDGAQKLEALGFELVGVTPGQFGA
jgi:hypothetical protein